MVVLKTSKELSDMKLSCKISAQALRLAGELIKPGVSTAYVDKMLHEFILSQGARPTFLGYGGFPASACISINDEIIHGIPSHKRVIREGDIVFRAGEVIAMDYDRTAARVAQENVERNHVEECVTTGVSDLLQSFTGKADLIIANIIADIVIRLFDELDAHLAEGGHLLASGIIDERVADVTEAALSHGFAIDKVIEESGWAAMVISRGDAQ